MRRKPVASVRSLALGFCLAGIILCANPAKAGTIDPTQDFNLTATFTNFFTLQNDPTLTGQITIDLTTLSVVGTALLTAGPPVSVTFPVSGTFFGSTPTIISGTSGGLQLIIEIPPSSLTAAGGPICNAGLLNCGSGGGTAILDSFSSPTVFYFANSGTLTPVGVAPVPEPGSLLLLGTGLLGIVGAVRRKWLG